MIIPIAVGMPAFIRVFMPMFALVWMRVIMIMVIVVAAMGVLMLVGVRMGMIVRKSMVGTIRLWLFMSCNVVMVMAVGMFVLTSGRVLWHGWILLYLLA
jgi:hypothetical protein